VVSVFRRVGVCLLLAIAMLAAMSTSALAAEWYVDASIGSDANPGDSPAAPFRSVTRASQAAAPGDRVHVADGLYASHTTGEVFPIQMIEGVLQGAGAASVTILGTDTSPVIEGTGITSSARIDGFTISGPR
jgi:hypothetical protein